MGFDTERFVRSVRKYQVLWNHAHVDYHDKLKTASAWQLVAYDHHSTAEAVKRYWKSLRDRYVREKRKVEDSRRSGVGSAESELYKPTWTHMNLFTFLHDPKAGRDTEACNELASPDEDTSMAVSVGVASVAAALASVAGCSAAMPADNACTENTSTRSNDDDEEDMDSDVATVSAKRAPTQGRPSGWIRKKSDASSPTSTTKAAASPSRKRPAASQLGSTSKMCVAPSDSGEVDVQLLKTAQALVAGPSNVIVTAPDTSSQPASDPFGHVVGLTLARLSPRNRSQTKLRIMQVLHEAEFPTSD